MDPEHEVCLCFRVSLRKIRAYLARENPPVASLISECLSAGTGCQWCVPFLKHLHKQHAAGQMPDLKVSPEEYMRARSGFHKTGERDAGVVGRAMDDAGPMGGDSVGGERGIGGGGPPDVGSAGR